MTLPETIKVLEDSLIEISPDRRKLLNSIAQIISEELSSELGSKVVFICTHNSRRSQIAQFWMAYFATKNKWQLESYSGGTEVTAFNANAIDAMRALGFEIEVGNGDNPMVHVTLDPSHSLQCYSKVYDDAANPSENFIALMTCSQANEACPFIPGAKERIALEFEDPKSSDGSGREPEVYHKRAMEIGRDLLYLSHLISDQWPKKKN